MYNISYLIIYKEFSMSTPRPTPASRLKAAFARERAICRGIAAW